MKHILTLVSLIILISSIDTISTIYASENVIDSPNLSENDSGVGGVHSTSSTKITNANRLFLKAFFSTPSVVSVSHQNVSNVAVSSNITVTFSESMDATSFIDSTVIVSGSLTGVIAGSISYDDPSKTMTFNPTADFLPGETITIVLTENIKSALDNNLDSAFVFSFRTAVSGTGHLQFADSLNIGDIDLSDLINIDIDNDGDEDIIAHLPRDNNMVVYKNSGGTYSEFFKTTNNQIYQMFHGDIDGDGDVDFLFKENSGNIITGAENDGSGNFTFHDSTDIVSSFFNGFELADFDGDGNLDFYYLYNNLENIVNWGNGDFTFTAPDSVTSSFTFNKLVSGDIDNDGDIDIIGFSKSNSQMETIINNGNRNFSTGSTYSSIKILTDGNPKIEDFNGDGFKDIIVIGSRNEFQIILNNGDGTFGSPISYFVNNVEMLENATPFDYDGDGDLDISFLIIQSDNESYGGILLFYNDGNGGFTNEDYFASNSGALVNFIPEGNSNLITDYDGDGDLDFIWIHSNFIDQYIMVLENEAPSLTSPITAASNISTSPSSYSATISWTNGDGARRLVMVKEGSSVDAVPSDNSGFNPNKAFGEGTEIGTGNFVVYAGGFNSITLSELSADTEYYVQVFEMNGVPGSETILTTGAPSTSFTTLSPPTFWTLENGTFTFTKTDYADQSLEANQDRIADSVWFTRAGNGGIFNAALETVYDKSEYSSPRGTLWALGTTERLMGGPDSLDNLVFDTFYGTLDRSIGDNIVGTDMVVYLEEDNTYFDIKFSSWRDGDNGGGFSYTRTTAPPDLIQHADTSLITYNDSTFTLVQELFDFSGNYADTALAISLISASKGNLYLDSNNNFEYNVGPDSLVTISSTFSFTPSGSTSLRYSALQLGVDTLKIKVASTSFSDSVEFTMINVESMPSIAGNNGEGGWYLLSNPFSTTVSELTSNIWTQGAINSNAPDADATLFTFDEDSSVYVAITTDLETTTLASGQGLLAYLFEDDDLGDGESDIDGGWPKNLSNYGNPFGTDLSISARNVNHDGVSGTSGSEGFKLFGNPFAWPLSADSVIASLKRQDPLANSYVYRWNPIAKTYQILSTGAINPYESVFVRVLSSGTTAMLNLDYEDADVSINEKEVSEPDFELKLTHEESGLESSSFLRFDEKGSTEIDSYDGYYLGSYASNFAHLYTMIGDQALTINNLPENIVGEMEFPIYLHSSLNGKFNLNWSRKGLPEELSFKLRNVYTGEVIDLREATEHSFEIISKDKYAMNYSPFSSGHDAKSKEAVQPIFVLIATGTLVSNETALGIPTEVELYQNFPNPFNPTSVIRFGVPNSAKVQLEVYDVLGRKVMTLINNETKNPGRYNITFNAINLASGMYIYRLVIGDEVLTKKMTLIK